MTEEYYKTKEVGRLHMNRNVGVYIFDEVEVLDFAGPFEVFSTASRVKARIEPKSSRPFEIFTIGDGKRTVQACGGLMREM